MAETSDTKFLNTCQHLLNMFMADAKYNSSNVLLGTVNLKNRLSAGKLLPIAVETMLAPQKIRINARQAAYAKIPPYVRSARGYLKSSGATDAEIADAQTYFRPLLGTRAAPKIKDDPNTTANEAEKSNSVSKLSYDSMSGNLVALRQFLPVVTAFVPNEEAVKLTTLDDIITETNQTNQAVSIGFVPLFQAWNERDAQLYSDEDSLLNLFRLAKEYYKSLYKPSDPEYKAVTALTLRGNSRSNR